MPAPSAYPLRLFQLGREATPGIVVPATAQYIGDAVPTILRGQYQSDYPRGIRMAYSQGGTPLQQGISFVRTTEATFEEIMASLECGVADGIDAGIANAMGHTYTPNLTGAPGNNFVTIEYAEGDGSATAFGYPGATGYPITMQAPYGFSTGFDFEFAFNAIAKLTERWIARMPTLGAASVPTPSLSVLSGRERISGSLCFVSFDSTWATLGNTPLTGTVRSGKYTVMTGIAPDYTLDGRAAMDFTQVMWGQNLGATLNLVMEVNATAAAEIKLWIAQNAGGGAIAPNSGNGTSTPRFVRIQTQSPNETATRNVSDGVSTLAGTTITSATLALTAGDLGATITATKAGTAGGLYTGVVVAINSATSATVYPPTPAAGTAEVVTLSNRRYLSFDNAFVYDLSKPPTFSQSNKAELVTMQLMTDYDPTSSKGLLAHVVNKVSTFT